LQQYLVVLFNIVWRDYYMTHKYRMYDYGYSNSVFPWKSAFYGKEQWGYPY